MRFPAGFAFIDDEHALDWIKERVRSENVLGTQINSLVPCDFDSYIRIFHPAQLNDAGKVRSVSWQEVAQWSGKTFRPSSQFHAVAGPALGTPSFPFAEPVQGLLDDEVCEALVRNLVTPEDTPQHCFFALWEGYSEIRNEAPSRVGVMFMGSKYMVGSAPIDRACKFPVSPSYWWPSDRHWVVVTNIDLDSTIIACDPVVASRILSDGSLEAVKVSPEARIDLWSDDE
jgi:hypothetical protein